MLSFVRGYEGFISSQFSSCRMSFRLVAHKNATFQSHGGSDEPREGNRMGGNLSLLDEKYEARTLQ
jgi:hypothetical protein